MEVVITYETLFDILRKEKGREELQHLPDGFVASVARFILDRGAEIEAAGGPAATGAQRLLIQHRNVQKILRELYDRRERKVLEMALNRARAASNLIDTDALLDQERSLYDGAVALLSERKAFLLEPLLKGETPAGVAMPEPPAQSETEATPAAEPDVLSRENCPVRFIAPVPKFLGLGGEIHGPFNPGDETELPGKIAAVLLKKNRVELA